MITIRIIIIIIMVINEDNYMHNGYDFKDPIRRIMVIPFRLDKKYTYKDRYRNRKMDKYKDR